MTYQANGSLVISILPVIGLNTIALSDNKMQKIQERNSTIARQESIPKQSLITSISLVGSTKSQACPTNEILIGKQLKDGYS
ncbi:MAG: hypothetical protein R6V50_00940 [Thermoplasmatota archaeon]